MIRKTLFFALFNFVIISIYANGVVFKKNAVGTYLSLKSSGIEVNIENQVAITKSTQTFLNQYGDSLSIKYGFPVPLNASATELKYRLNGRWHKAVFSSAPQDTATGSPSDNVDEQLVTYLGNNPLYFDLTEAIGEDSTVIVELTYVELLEYKFGKVNYSYPNDYREINTTLIDEQRISVSLKSDRIITDFMLLSHAADTSSISSYEGYLSCAMYEKPADANYSLQYSLSQDDLGLFSLSTYIHDSLSVDSYGRGFFALIVEPNPSDQSETIEKVFTLIIDRSGSMSGNKMVQARDAAEFIVDHLNEGDKFNIVSFSTDISSFRPSHVEYNQTNKGLATDYINSLEANGSTNISGAFDTAIPQFLYADNTTANIIIFLTDGEQTSGITDTDELITHIDNLVLTSEKEVTIFTFGIGSSTNARLLTTIARNNKGLAEFLENNQLEEVITEFYLMIQNPVLLNTSVEFDPNIIAERYPVELQNLYKGNQLMLFGRYSEAVPISITFKGTAFSNDVVYQYDLALSDTTNHNYQFLMKLWAKVKIDELLSQYYLNIYNQELAESIKDEIIELSVNYGVISPFTSFIEGGEQPVGLDEWDVMETRDAAGILSNEFITILSLGPNPAEDVIFIKLETSSLAQGQLNISLVNTFGQPVYINTEFVSGRSDYSFEIDLKNLGLPPGIYVIIIEHQGKILTQKVIVK